jgi:hypothetical protein
MVLLAAPLKFGTRPPPPFLVCVCANGLHTSLFEFLDLTTRKQKAFVNMAEWTIQGFCESQVPSDLTTLHPSSQEFVKSLGLSLIHPFCGAEAPHPYYIPGIPRQGPLTSRDHFETWYDVVVTVIAMGLPSSLALGELWLRLFAFVIAPLGIAHLGWKSLSPSDDSKPTTKRQEWFLSVTCLLTVASSIVLLTDTLYVLEFGPRLGMTLLACSLATSWITARRYKLAGVLPGKFCLLLLAAFIIYDYETGEIHFGHASDEVKIDAGLYYKHNPTAERIVEHWPASFRSYDSYTPWMPTGDSRTG